MKPDGSCLHGIVRVCANCTHCLVSLVIMVSCLLKDLTDLFEHHSCITSLLNQVHSPPPTPTPQNNLKFGTKQTEHKPTILFGPCSYAAAESPRFVICTRPLLGPKAARSNESRDRLAGEALGEESRFASSVSCVSHPPSVTKHVLTFLA